MNIVKWFGKQVKNERKSKGLSQEELAEKCNLSTQQIGNIELGKSEPKLNSILAICVECDIDMNYLKAQYISWSHDEKDSDL